MTENKNVKELIKFGDYLTQVGAELHDEVLGHDYLDEKDLQQVLGPKFIQKKLPTSFGYSRNLAIQCHFPELNSTQAKLSHVTFWPSC